MAKTWSLSSFNTLQREHEFRNPPSKSRYDLLHAAVKPHIESFNALTEANLLNLAVKDIGEVVVFDFKTSQDFENRQNIENQTTFPKIHRGNKLSIRIDEVQIARPSVSSRERFVVNRKSFPKDCRERLSTYRGRLLCKIVWKINDSEEFSEFKEMGQIPIMLRSNRCQLEGMSPLELVQHKEESEEIGGYFIINGIEKLIRMLIVPKKNIAIALIRKSLTKRGPKYTPFGVTIRCARQDQSTITNTLHYLNDGNVMLRFSWKKSEYLLPLVMVLQALSNCSDLDIFKGIVKDQYENNSLLDQVELMLKNYRRYSINSQVQALVYIGSKFRIVLNPPEDLTDLQVGELMLNRVLLVHLQENIQKYRLLLFMASKLYSLVRGECCADNTDSVQNQEILLPGHLYGMIIKEKIQDFLNDIVNIIVQDRNKTSIDFNSKYISKCFTRTNTDIGRKLHYFLSTGNLVSHSGLDLMQTNGFTVVAEKINFYRFLSHFRMVHRGSFFAELKTTTVRKLLPESWGFLCPVHTPDGAPCGLLNHLAHKCLILSKPVSHTKVEEFVYSLGVETAEWTKESFCVQLDGKVLGYCSFETAKRIAKLTRLHKGTALPQELEIALIPKSVRGQYPGLFMFCCASRMLRPVFCLQTNNLDLIGTFESVYMEIAATVKEIEEHHEFVELNLTNILSILANSTPFSDFNQSPRNMYQCQMCKQTMGSVGTALEFRTDNKLYKLETLQTPIVRSFEIHDQYGFDHYPNGLNAIVAVLSYSGYDMEDALILNKSSKERGFAYGTIYKCETVDLTTFRRKGEPLTHHFGFYPGTESHGKWPKLDKDGLPFVGEYLCSGDAMVAYYDETVNKTLTKEYKGSESAFVDQVRIIAIDSANEAQIVVIKLRIPRSPLIGDKFSSRHGQKGVLSMLLPSVDMPFSESGIIPDIIINPHAFPSRMTIGMFIESLAGKSGSLHGLSQDSTPFIFSETDTASEYFGKQLKAANFNFFGNEVLYSGISGKELKAEIYMGVVYYQRLRHMVNDKFQVRSTGPIHNLTRQPIKGRKRAGGIRFGEMERDSIIAHGSAFLLQDRLMNCSDYSQVWICKSCGSILSTISTTAFNNLKIGVSVRCRFCAKNITLNNCTSEVWQDGSGTSFTGGTNTILIAIPSVFIYLASELMAANIKMTLSVR